MLAEMPTNETSMCLRDAHLVLGDASASSTSASTAFAVAFASAVASPTSLALKTYYDAGKTEDC